MATGFEWDPQKNAANIAKHEIDFDDAVGVFDGPVLEQELPQRQGGEKRLLAIRNGGGQGNRGGLHAAGRESANHFSAECQQT